MGKQKKNAWVCEHVDTNHCAKGLCERCYNKSRREIKRAQYMARHRRIKAELGPNFKKWNRERHLKHRYGITPDQWEWIFDRQHGRCVCGKKFEKEGKSNVPHLDHNHKCCPKKSCGKCVRGMLCFRCNSVLGFLESEPHLLPQFLVEYLKRFS